jgi:hypothetical protein
VPKPKSKRTEVVASPENDRRQRRHFSAEEKERILCRRPFSGGATSALASSPTA